MQGSAKPDDPQGPPPSRGQRGGGARQSPWSTPRAAMQAAAQLHKEMSKVRPWLACKPLSPPPSLLSARVTLSPLIFAPGRLSGDSVGISLDHFAV